MQKILSILALSAAAHGALAQNLLTNADFSAGDTGFSSDYSFVPSGQSAVVGTFGIRTSSTDFNSGYNAFGDHTTGSGNMMLLDGAQSPGAVAWSETVPVETNQDYVFSFWAASSDGSSPAQLNVTVNGTPLATGVALSASGGLWQRFAFAWNSGPAASAQIAIVDQNTVSLGNDFALDDLAFGLNNLAPVVASIFTAVEIDWNSQASVNYQVQYSTALNTNVWLDLGNPVPGTGGTMAAFDSSRSHPQRFYRIQTLP